MTRGIRNNNPLNIRLSSAVWKGQVRNPQEKTFVTFQTMRHGLRAAFITLRTYFQKHHLDTVSAIIRRWAPETENATESYIRTVCNLTKFGGNERLTFCKQTICQLVRAMALVESAQLFEISQIEAAWEEFSSELESN